ncbi:hypothetical protein FB451DRAFT_689383 [Mycena latifolia]|nr:hypothetical protein FB451DRAFT_689383 [Mycena latifolia]
MQNREPPQRVTDFLATSDTLTAAEKAHIAKIMVEDGLPSFPTITEQAAEAWAGHPISLTNWWQGWEQFPVRPVHIPDTVTRRLELLWRHALLTTGPTATHKTDARNTYLATIPAVLCAMFGGTVSNNIEGLLPKTTFSSGGRVEHQLILHNFIVFLLEIKLSFGTDRVMRLAKAQVMAELVCTRSHGFSHLHTNASYPDSRRDPQRRNRLLPAGLRRAYRWCPVRLFYAIRSRLQKVCRFRRTPAHGRIFVARSAPSLLFGPFCKDRLSVFGGRHNGHQSHSPNFGGSYGDKTGESLSARLGGHDAFVQGRQPLFASPASPRSRASCSAGLLYSPACVDGSPSRRKRRDNCLGRTVGVACGFADEPPSGLRPAHHQVHFTIMGSRDARQQVPGLGPAIRCPDAPPVSVAERGALDARRQLARPIRADAAPAQSGIHHAWPPTPAPAGHASRTSTARKFIISSFSIPWIVECV